MFGIGPQELVMIVLLLLVLFGPGKAVSMARDLGHFVNEARSHVEEFTGELLDDEEDHDEPISDPHFEGGGDDEVREGVDGKELARGEEGPSSEVHART